MEVPKPSTISSALQQPSPTPPRDKPAELGEQVLQTQPASDQLEDAFQDFVGQTFFAEMIKAYRSTQQPSAYFHGGRAEEIFQGQFDQLMTEQLSDSSAEKLSKPMLELFLLNRKT